MEKQEKGYLNKLSHFSIPEPSIMFLISYLCRCYLHFTYTNSAEDDTEYILLSKEYNIAVQPVVCWILYYYKWDDYVMPTNKSCALLWVIFLKAFPIWTLSRAKEHGVTASSSSISTHLYERHNEKYVTRCEIKPLYCSSCTTRGTAYCIATTITTKYHGYPTSLIWVMIRMWYIIHCCGSFLIKDAPL